MAAKIKNLVSVSGLLIVLCILVLVNVIFAHMNLRFDATEENLYSLSKGTYDILNQLEQDVVIKVFYTSDLPNIPASIKNYSRQVIDFLSEYEYNSDGKIRIEIINPKIDSEEEEWAEKYGIRRMDLPTGDRLYFGLVAVSADQEEAIAFLDPTRETQLEYDITRIIAKVQSPEKQKIGVISELPVFGNASPYAMPGQSQEEPWFFITELKKNYDVEQIDAESTKFDDDLDLLLLLSPGNLKDPLLFAIDQFVLKGGNVICFYDPMPVSKGAAPNSPPGASFKKLLDAWGIAIDATKVVADLNYATRLRTQNNQIEQNLTFLSLPREAFNDQNLVTSELDSMLLAVAGAITKKDGFTGEFEPLLSSSESVELVDSFRIRLGTQDIRKDFKSAVEKMTLGAMIRGTFKTAFPAGPPKTDTDKAQDDASSEKQAPTGDFLKEGAKQANLIIVGDADLLFDPYYVQRQNFLGFPIANIFNDNLNFLLNSCEMLTGSDELIGIRSRGRFDRAFTKVKELEKAAQARWLATEQELERKVEATNRKLQELERTKDSSQQMILSAEQEAEIDKFQEEKIKISQQLKEVRRKLRGDIERLGIVLKLINICLVPLLVSAAGILFGLHRQRKAQQQANGGK